MIDPSTQQKFDLFNKAHFSYSFLVYRPAGKIQMSERVTKTLRFVPVTVLPAIITIQILSVNSSMEFDLKIRR